MPTHPVGSANTHPVGSAKSATLINTETDHEKTGDQERPTETDHEKTGDQERPYCTLWGLSRCTREAEMADSRKAKPAEPQGSSASSANEAPPNKPAGRGRG